jgi:hypothetical protein
MKSILLILANNITNFDKLLKIHNLMLKEMGIKCANY